MLQLFLVPLQSNSLESMLLDAIKTQLLSNGGLEESFKVLCLKAN